MDKMIVKVENVNGILVTTSNRVAEELGVNHRDLLEKIDGYIKKFGSAENSAGFYILSSYIHLQNKQKYRNYLITKKGIAQLVGGYSSAVEKAFDLNVAYINKFEEMEKQLQGIGVPSTFAEALKLAYEQQLIIEQQKPKVEYHDKVLHSDKLITTTSISKDLGISAFKLHKILNELGIIYKKSGIWVLYSKYQDMVPEYADYHINEFGQQLKWTEKGRKWIIDITKEMI